MASGHVNRIKRPDTWLHRPMLQNVKKVLANPEPSTHVKVFGCRPHEGGAAHSGAGVRKPPMEETAGRDTLVVRRALWGFECRERCG